MLFDITPFRTVLNGTVYQIEGYSIHNHIRYANAVRWHRGRFIEVECEEVKRILGGRIH